MSAPQIIAGCAAIGVALLLMDGDTTDHSAAAGLSVIAAAILGILLLTGVI